jgi:ribosome-binding factor A
MPTRRQARLNELLFEELSLLIPGRLDDPRLEGVVVRRVEVTQDMTVAKVYVTLGEADAAEAAVTLAALAHAAGPLRAELGALGLPRLPQLVFARDRQFESGERVLAILHDLEEAEGDAAANRDGDDEPGDASHGPAGSG